MRIFEALKNRKFAKENNLTLEEVHLFNEINQKGKMDVARFRLYLKAREIGISLEDYKEYQELYTNNGTVEEYKAYIDFKKENTSAVITFDEFVSYVRHYESSLSPREYQAFLLAKKHLFTEEQSIEYGKKYREKYTIERYKDFTEAVSMGVSIEQYDQIQKAQSLGMTVKELENYEKCRTIQFFTEAECMQYAKDYSHIELTRYADMCSAARVGITISQYDEWKENLSGKFTLEQYSRYLKATAMNLTLDEYDELIAANELGLSIDDYRLYKQNNHSLTINEFKKCKDAIRCLKDKTSFVISDLSQIKMANKLGVESVVLDVSIKELPEYSFSACQSFREIILPWGLKTIGVGTFQDCIKLREISIPGSVRVIPGGVFNGCTSLERIELNDGIKTVNITGWVNLPSLKNVASACSISDFEIDKTEGYYKYLTEEDVPSSEKGVIKTLHIQNGGKLSAERSYGANNYHFYNYPQLETVILDCTVSGISITKCPNLKVVLIQNVDNTWCEYYKNGNIKNTYAAGDNSLLLTGDFVNNSGIRFLIIKSSLKKISTSGLNEMPELCWLHVPSSCEIIEDLNAKNLKTIGATLKTKLPETIERVLLSDQASWGKKTDDAGLVYLDIEKCTYTIKQSFLNCEQTKNICGLERDIERSSVKSIAGTLKILEGTTSIPSQYMSKTLIDKLILPFSLESIGQRAFEQCENLSAVSFSRFPKLVSPSAFESCKSIKVTCGDSLKPTFIMYRIKNFDWPPLENARISEEVLCENEYAGQRIKSIIIESSVKKISSTAFDNCSILESISILGTPEIAENAFKGCTAVSTIKWDVIEPYRIAGKTGFPKVKEIKIHPLATKIREGAFENWGIEELFVPGNIQSIESYAFANCKKLKKVCIEGNPVIATNAFEGCINICSIEIKHHDGIVANIAGRTGFPKVSRVVIPEGTTVLDTECFARWGLEEIEIPPSVKRIGKGAFESCRALKKFEICLDTQIGERAFYGCVSLTTINEYEPNTIPMELIKSAAADSFYACTGFKSAKFTAKEQLAKYIELINSCNIETVYIPATVNYEAYVSLLKIKSVVEVLPSNIDEQLPTVRFLKKMPPCSKNLKKLFIPQCINQITDGSFSECVKLTHLYLSPSVVVFDFHAFTNCTKLKKIVCHKNQKILIPENELPNGFRIETYGNTEVTHSIETIGISAELPKGTDSLSKQMITKIIIPDGTAFIPEKAFSGMKSLREVEINAQIDRIEANAFCNCSRLKTITLPSSVSEIGEMAFAGCKSLEAITLPQGVKRLKQGTFKGCSSLTNVSGMDNVGYVEEDAFTDCIALKQIVFSREIFSIKNAFVNCTSLEMLVIPVDIAEFMVDISSCTSLKTMYLPQNIDSFKCVTAENNQINVVANRGSSWKTALNVANVTYYKKADIQEKIEQLLADAGYGVKYLEQESLHFIHRDEGIGSRDQVQKAGSIRSRKTAGRAEWSISQGKNEDAVFTNGPADVDEMIKSLTNNDMNECYSQRKVDAFSNVNLDSTETVAGEEKRITSNIFSVELDTNGISVNQFVISLVDVHGNVNSDQVEVSISNKTKVKQIKIQLQLKAGVPNGRYFIVVSDSKGDKSFYSEPIRVDIAFAMDDEFAF